MTTSRDDPGERFLPVTVAAAEPFAEPADLLGPPLAVVPEPAAPDVTSPDRLVPAAGTGLPGWWAVVRAILASCGTPLLLVSVCCAGLPQVISNRVAGTVVVAPLLPDLAGGTGLLLLPLLWLTVVAVGALLQAVCVAVVVGRVTGWAADGRAPGPRVLSWLIGHRIGRLWGWLLLAYAAQQLLAYLLPWSPADDPGQTSAGLWRPGGPVGWTGVAMLWALTVLVGLLGPVILFERARGPRRVVRLLTRGPGPAVLGLVLAAGLPVLLPPLVGVLAGPLAGPVPVPVLGIVATALGTLVWLVAATVTYAAAAAVTSGPTVLTAAFLRAALAADEA